MLKYAKTLSPFLSLLLLATPFCQGAEIETKSKAKIIQIFVSSWVRLSNNELQKKVLTIDVKEGIETIGEIKEKVKKKTGLLPRLCDLTFAGPRLEDNKTLEDYGIRKESTLYRRIHPGQYVKIKFQTESDVFVFSTFPQYYDAESGKYKNKTLDFFKREQGISLNNKISFDKNTNLSYSNPPIDIKKCKLLDEWEKSFVKGFTSSQTKRNIPSSAEGLSDEYDLIQLLDGNESISNEEENPFAEDSTSGQTQADISSSAEDLSDNDKKDIGFIDMKRGILCLGFLGYKAFKIGIKRIKWMNIKNVSFI